MTDITLNDVAGDVKKLDQKLEILIKGNGGKGIHQRLDEVELIANSCARERDCIVRRKEISTKYDRRQKDLRWGIEVAIKFAPWVLIVLMLFEVI